MGFVRKLGSHCLYHKIKLQLHSQIFIREEVYVNIKDMIHYASTCGFKKKNLLLAVMLVFRKL